MENNFNIEVDKSSKNYYNIYNSFGSILLFTIIYLIINSNADRKQNLLNIDRHTRVVEIYSNKDQHNLGYVRFSNGINEFLEYPIK